MRVYFEICASSFMNHINYRIYAYFPDSHPLRARFSPQVAGLINQYATVKVADNGLGYVVDLPDNVAMALQYLLWVGSCPPEEVERIIKEGRTEIHDIKEALGVECPRITAIFESVVGKGATLDFAGFPNMVLRINWDNGPTLIVVFSKDINLDFVRRALNGALTDDEMRVLRGISLLSEKAQIKFMRLLSQGSLSVEALAVSLRRAALSANTWKPMVEWLECNGFAKEANDVIVRKTLLK